MSVNSDGAWFVNKLRSTLKPDDDHRPAPPVCVSCASRSFHQQAGHRTMVEEFFYFTPIGSQMLQKLGGEVDAILDTAHKLARQPGLFRKTLSGYFAV